MLDLAFIPGWLHILLTMAGCFGVALQAALTATRYMQRQKTYMLMRTACECAIMLYLAVCVFCLSATRLLLLEGTAPVTAFRAVRYAACLLTFILCAITTRKSRRWDTGLMAVFALATSPCFDAFPFFKWLLAAAILFIALRAAILIPVMLRASRTKINRMSIKHALDTLPDGMLFARHDGSVMLQNKTMMELTHRLTGSMAADAESLWRFVQSDSRGMYTKLSLDGGRVLFRLDNGSAWEFSKQLVDMGGKSVTRILAADVTDADKITRELETINAALSSSAERLQYILDNYNEIKTVREAIFMKTRLHDRMGQRISLVSRAIADNTEESYLEIVSLLRGLLDDLKDMGRGAPPPTLGEIEASFAFVGTRIVLNGALPEEERGSVLLSVLREAATNAVRHAGAHRVEAEVIETPSAIVMRIVNDGKRPPETITEGGGIGGMRARILACGGRLDVETRPVFKLTVTLDK